MTDTNIRPQDRNSRVGFGFVAFFAVAIAFVSGGTYAANSLDFLGENSPVALVYAEGSAFLQAALYLHIVGGVLALVLGPFQFSRRLRDRFPRPHRVSGRVYLMAVALGGLAGLAIAPVNSAGLIGTVGFALLALLWLATATMAYRHARRGELDHHRAWMIRNYALTFAAVTLRIWLPILIITYTALGVDDPDEAFAAAYLYVPFLAWVPNLILAEWLIRRRGLPSLMGG